MAGVEYERAKQAAMAGYLDPGPKHLNCAQAVIQCGLLAMGGDPALTDVGIYLGGGIARTGQACGAVSGTAVTLGLRDHLCPGAKSGDAIPPFDWLQKFTKDFEEKFGAVSCRDLLGCDISTAEGFREAKKNQATRRCPEFVGYACDRLAEVLDR